MKKRINIKAIVTELMTAMMTVSYIEPFNMAFLKYAAVLVSIIFIFAGTNSKVKKSELIPFTLMFSAFVISCLFQDTTLLQKGVSIIFYFTLLSWTFFGRYLISSPIVLLKMAAGIFWAMTIGMFLTRNESLQQLDNVYNSRRRVWGGFTHANTLGSICVAGIILIICYVFFLKKSSVRKSDIIKISIMLCTFLGFLYLSKSRTSLIVFIMFCCVLLLKYIRKFKKNSRLYIVLILIVGSSAIIYLFAAEYALSDTTFLMRLQSTEKTDIIELPFWVGRGMLRTEDVQNILTPGTYTEIAWVMLFYKNGVIGIILYIFLIYSIYKIYKKNLHQNKQPLMFWAILISMLVGTLGEAYIVNITNVISMVEFLLLNYYSHSQDISNELTSPFNSSTPPALP